MRDTADPRLEVVEVSPPVRRSFASRFTQLGQAMRRDIERLAPDIIFLPGNFHLPLVITLRNVRNLPPLVAKLSNPLIPSGALAKPARWLLRRYASHIAGVAAMNSGIAAEAKGLLPQVNVTTLYDPVYIEHSAVQRRIRQPHEPLHILWAGRLEPQKDVLLALKTIAALHARTSAKLMILGSGSQRQYMLDTINNMGLHRIVEAPGHVAGIDAWLKQADVLLVSSQFEGGPAVAVEALAHGVPVVSTDCSHFLHDIMTVPEAGRIVPSRNAQDLAQALLDVCAQPCDNVQTLIDLVGHLEPVPCAKAYLDWFEEIIAQRP